MPNISSGFEKMWRQCQDEFSCLERIVPLETELRHFVSLIQQKNGRFIVLNVTAEIQIKVPFHDIDVKGIVWHGNYLRYFEEARAELLDKIGYGYFEMKDSGYAWPVVDARVKYIKPLHLQQNIKVLARLVEYESPTKNRL